METMERPRAAGGRSRWWYAAPLLLAAVGGVVAYLALRRDDARLARRCLIAGAAVTAACVALQAGMATGALLP